MAHHQAFFDENSIEKHILGFEAIALFLKHGIVFQISRVLGG